MFYPGAPITASFLNEVEAESRRRFHVAAPLEAFWTPDVFLVSGDVEGTVQADISRIETRKMESPGLGGKTYYSGRSYTLGVNALLTPVGDSVDLYEMSYNPDVPLSLFTYTFMVGNVKVFHYCERRKLFTDSLNIT